MNQLAAYEWVCGQCSLINHKVSVKCAACNSLKSTGGLTAESRTVYIKGGSWFCSSCTFENSFKNEYCAMCSSPHKYSFVNVEDTENNRGLGARQNSPRTLFSNLGDSLNTTETWVCENCNILNSVLSFTCEVCLQMKCANEREHHQGLGVHQNSQRTPFSNLGGALNTAETWVCENCTSLNSIVSFNCDVCLQMKCAADREVVPLMKNLSKHTPNSDTSMVIASKQRSELLEDLRLKEEMESLILWRHIVQYCRDVSRLFRFWC